MPVLRDNKTPFGSHVQAAPGRDETLDRFPKGRRCAESGCITRLHQYHPGAYCYVHEGRHRAEVERVLSEAA